MEIKAELNKPYTESERLSFIVEQNHKLGYTIEEQEDKIVALGKTDEEITKEQEERLNHLTCTALDIANLINTLGLTDKEILQFLNANPSIQLKLTLCKDVYCGVARQLCPIKLSEELTLTDEMIVAFFKKKYNIV